MDIDDRHTLTITNKRKKTTYMSSARVDSDGHSLINEENIEKEVKYYKNLKSKNTWKSFEEYSDYIS